MKLSALCQAAGIAYPQEAEKTEIEAVESDSRYVHPNTLFVCIRGLHTDGHAYIADAVHAGAVCILTEEGAEFEVPKEPVLLLKSSDTRQALAFLYHAWYGFPTQRLKVIGVTGTNGKTSVTHMLRAIFEASLCKCGVIGTIGCLSAGRRLQATSANAVANMTTPDPAQLYRVLAEMAEDGVEYVFMEATSHALALGKLAPIRFEAAIFTNLTPEHLDFHQTMQSYAAAKAKLFAQSRLCIINRDSPYSQQMISQTTGRVVRCSELHKSDYRAEEILQNEVGVSYILSSGSLHKKLFCPIPGTFTVMNSMQAAVCALELGISAHTVRDALSSLNGIQGRMERVKLGLGADFTVLIDYAHTPDALENLLQTAKRMREGENRIVLLFGCGGERDKTKRPVMGKIAEENADLVIVTSDNSRGEEPETIISEILAGMKSQKERLVIPNRRQAIEYAVYHAQAGDIILLAGKGHEKYEITREGRRPFFEKKIVLEAFKKRLRLKKDDNTETKL